MISAVVVAAGLVWFAARTDQASPQASGWMTAIDVAVGVAFLVAAAVAVGAVWQRRLVAAVGVAWLLGSMLTAALPLHHGVLMVALLTFPSGRLRGRSGWLTAALAVPVAVGFVPQIWIAAGFLLVGSVVLLGRTPHWYPVVSAGAVAVVLATSWTFSRRDASFDPGLALLSYDVVVLLVALAYPVAAWSVVRARRRLADEVLSGTPVAGLGGFAAVLGQALHDPTLQVHRWQGVGYFNAEGEPVEPQDHWMHVDADNAPLAVVEHNATALADPLTRQAVESAVRLAVTNVRLQEEQLVRLAELEAARARVVAAADAQRSSVAEDLRLNVAPLLVEAHNDVAVALQYVVPAAADRALKVVDETLAAAVTEINDLVAGIPPARLGHGLIRSALESLAGSVPDKVTVTCSEDATGTPPVEAALYYVCSEALANAAKHAEATHISIDLTQSAGQLRLTVVDNGRGGADPAGSGLTGLADRLAAYGGRLRVDSPPGAGTTLTALI
jgi:signal transduction histidine kinase